MAKISTNQLAKTIASYSLGSKEEPKKIASEIAAYLLEEKRVNQLDSLLRDVQKFWAESGYVNIIARVARPLPEVAYNQLATPFKNKEKSHKTVMVSPLVDPSIIGGASLELSEERLDLSIANRMRLFKKAINLKGF